jgi:hypothetical protein
MHEIGLRLSRTHILGPAYWFRQKPGKSPRLEFRDPVSNATRSYSIELQSIGNGPGHVQRLLIKQGGRDLADQRFVFNDGTGYILNYNRDRKLGRTEIKYILRNIALRQLFDQHQLPAANLVCGKCAWEQHNQLGVLSFNLGFGFSVVSEDKIAAFVREAAEKNRPISQKIMTDYEFGERLSLQTIIVGDRFIFFHPPVNPRELDHYVREPDDLLYPLGKRGAFINCTDYAIATEAAAILPDYVKLLPANPQF